MTNLSPLVHVHAMGLGHTKSYLTRLDDILSWCTLEDSTCLLLCMFSGHGSKSRTIGIIKHQFCHCNSMQTCIVDCFLVLLVFSVFLCCLEFLKTYLVYTFLFSLDRDSSPDTEASVMKKKKLEGSTSGKQAYFWPALPGARIIASASVTIQMRAARFTPLENTTRPNWRRCDPLLHPSTLAFTAVRQLHRFTTHFIQGVTGQKSAYFCCSSHKS